MADIVSVGFKADSTQLKGAKTDLDKMGSSAKKADVAVDTLTDGMRKGGKAAKSYGGAVQGASKSNGRLVNSAQNASYQVADLAVQLEGGTSFARAFGQQGSQLLAAFGPYGAVAGAAVAVTAALASSFLDAGMGADELEERILDTTEKLEDLTEAQRTFLALQFDEKIQDQGETLAGLADKYKEVQDRINKNRLALTVQTEQFEKMGLPLAEITRRTQSYTTIIADLEKKLVVLDASMSTEGETLAELRDKWIELTGTLEDFGDGVTKEALNPAERLLATMREQAETLGKTTAETQLYRLSLTEGVNPALIEEAEALQKTIDAYNAKTKAQKDSAAQAARDEAEREREQDRINRAAESIRFQMLSEEEQIRASYERRREIINDSTLLSEQEKAEIIGRISKEEEEKRFLSMASSTASILAITANQMSQMSALYEEGSAAGKAFFLVSQGLAAANAVVDGLQGAMAVRLAYQNLAAMSGPAAPALLAAGEVHANASIAMGVATAGMIAGQTIASFNGGGHTGSGPRSGGVDGIGGFPAILHPNETVIDHTRGQSMGGVNIQIMNYGNDSVTATQNGDSIQVIIGQVKRSISNDIDRGVGPVTKSMTSTFGLTRRGNR